MKVSAQFAARAALALLAAGAVAVVIYNQSTAMRLRAEQQALLNQAGAAQELTRRNEEIARLRQENLEVERLREENKDLPGLRNQARQLRRQLEEQQTLQAENRRLQEKISVARNPEARLALPPDYVARGALTDAGLATPEATVQTMFWAMSQGNIERAGQCQMVASSAPITDKNRQELIEQMKAFPGFRIATKNVISPDEVELGIQASVNGVAAPVKLRRVDNEWKFSEN